MAIVFRTDGAWGTGKGANLVPAEVDGNFYDLDGKITYLQDNPPEAITPIAINIEGGLFTMQMSDGSTLGPIVMTMPVPQWRGDWTPSTPYLEMDFFVAPDGGMGAVMLSHTSAATFDWAALQGGVPVYQEIVGASGTTAGIGDLIDVAIASAGAGDLLTYNAAASLWQNHTPSYVATTVLPAFGGSTGSIAGLQGLVPAPAAGDAAAGKVLGAGGGWVVPAGGTGTGSLAGLADVAIVSPVNLSLLQYSSVDGKWHNQTLATLGAGTVTSVGTGAGLTGGPITGVGSISLAAVATQMLLANVTGSTAPPSGVSLSTLLDAVLGTGRGSVMWRSAIGWVALTAGIAGQFLQTGGVGADVTWGTPSGAGTVTQVNSGTGLTGGPITAAGTLSLATVSDNHVLANISGATAAPVGTALTLLLDHALGATQGMIVYRGTASWSALAPGASGAVLTSGGAAANPAWVTGTGTGTVTQVNTSTGLIGGPITGIGTISLATIANQTLLANISGATAAPSPNTMSAIMDAVFSASRGSVLYRGAAGWAALGPGTAGQVLTTAGTSADPSWAAGGGASISTADTPPGSPADGDAWWDSAGGQLYIWYNDGTSSQWVPVSNQPGPAGTSIPLPVAIASGGTGQTTAAAALTALGAAPLASPVFTGDPRAPTPATADSDTSIATTAYVQAQGYATSVAMTAADNLRVLKAGDTMTGTLVINTTGWSILDMRSPAGNQNMIFAGRGGATYRWDIVLGDSSAESGSNAGSNFSINRYNDAGTSLGAPLTMSRATGNATFNGEVIVTPAGTARLTVVDGGIIAGTSFLPSATNALVCGSSGNAWNAVWSYAFSNASDPSLKRDIAPPPLGALARVQEIAAATYKWKDDAADAPTHWGFLAPDVQAAMGQDFGGVVEDKESGLKGINYHEMTAVLWKAVQELAAKVAVLEGKPA